MNRTRLRRACLAAVAAAGVALVLAPQIASAAPVEPGGDEAAFASWLRSICRPEISATTLAVRTVPLVGPNCDFRDRTIVAGPLSALVPLEESASVEASAQYVAGTPLTAAHPHSLRVSVLEGRLTVSVNDEAADPESADEGPEATGEHEEGPAPKPEVEPSPAARALAVPSECNQTAYKLRKDAKNYYYDWYYNDYGRPAYFNRNLALLDIQSAARNIDIGYNDCGLRQSLKTKILYKGSTATPTGISYGKCTRRDNKDVVGWGPLASHLLAVNCSWKSWSLGRPDPIGDSDTVISDAHNQFFYTKPSSCSGRYELQGVMTHEFGHGFALKHVSESTYPYMTMSPEATPCSYRDSTLGRGDYNALKKLYGA